MDRRNRRRALRPRLLVATVVVAAYATTLAWASSISATDGAEPVRDAVATAGSSAAAQVQAAAAATASSLATAPHEAPMTTLAIAALLLLVGGGWYAVGTLRSRSHLARRARLVVRSITTII